MADFDHWRTTDPADAEMCNEHGRYYPCPICWQEACEREDEAKREEK